MWGPGRATHDASGSPRGRAWCARRQWEELNVASVSADGKVITLQSPLQFNHPGARNGDDLLEFLPHVGDLSRNVIVRSENAAGVRGHTIFMGRADVDLRYVAFVDLGRTTNYALDSTTFDDMGHVTHIGTNQIGRYPVHFHHLMGPIATPANGYQYTLKGNSIYTLLPDHHFKWAVTIHDAHYGLVQDNVLYNWAGAGMVTEDGSESFNLIDHNFVVRGTGVGGRDAGGTEGQAFWFRGPNNYVTNNVAANYFGTSAEAAYGYKYYMVYLRNIRVPCMPLKRRSRSR